MVKSKNFSVRVDGTAYLSHGDREAIGKSECKLDKAMNINQDANEISWAIEPFQGDIVETKIGDDKLPSWLVLSAKKTEN